MKHVIDAKTAVQRQILSFPNIAGIGVGKKQVGGNDTDIHAVRVYVEKKLPLSKLDQIHAIPPTFGTVPSDVIEIGKVYAAEWQQIQAHARSNTSRIRPVLGGYSIGVISITAGTYGGLVKDTQDGNKLVAISNNHVFANRNLSPVGANIIQPGKYDRGSDPSDRVAKLKRFVPIDFGFGGPSQAPHLVFPSPPINVRDTAMVAEYIEATSSYLKRLIRSNNNSSKAIETIPNVVDVAIATPTNQSIFSTSISGVGKPGPAIDPMIGMTVVKSGRTTGVTIGRIVDIDLSVNVFYGTAPSGDLIGVFDDVFMIAGSGFSAGGDSGSRVMKNSSSKETVGILFAGSTNSTIICKAKQVESQLGVKF